MAPRRPTAAHIVSLAQPGQTVRQFIAQSALDLARQVKTSCPDLPPALVEQLARLTVERRARVELPDLLIMRHVSTLTAEPVPSMKAAQVGRSQTPSAGAGLDAGRAGEEASRPAPADHSATNEAAQAHQAPDGLAPHPSEE